MDKGDDNDEAMDRVKALTTKVDEWVRSNDDSLGSRIAQAVKEASEGSGIAGVAQKASGAADGNTAGLPDGDEEDEEDEEGEEGEEGEESEEDVGEGDGEGREEGHIVSASAGQKRKRDSRAAPGRPKKPRIEKSSLWQEVAGLTISLPSTCLPGAQSRPCLADAVAVEKKLRQEEAHDCLNMLRTQLITNALLDGRLKQQSKRARQGKVKTTRHSASVAKRRANIREISARYRRAYGALKCLDGLANTGLKPLQPCDVRAFVMRTEDQVLGDSKKQPSWIWQTIPFYNTKHMTEHMEDYTKAGK